MLNVVRFMLCIKYCSKNISLTLINCIKKKKKQKLALITNRGQSGFDNSGRGYYWADQREQQQSQPHHHQQENGNQYQQSPNRNWYSQSQKPQQNNLNNYNAHHNSYNNNNNNNNAQQHTSSGIAPEYYQVKQSHNTPSNVQTVSSNAIGVDTGANANANSSDRWSNKDNKDSKDSSKDIDKEKAR